MKTQEIVIDGKKENIIIDIDGEDKDDTILYDNLTDTIELSDKMLKAIEDTIELDTGDINE